MVALFVAFWFEKPSPDNTKKFYLRNRVQKEQKKKSQIRPLFFVLLCGCVKLNTRVAFLSSSTHQTTPRFFSKEKEKEKEVEKRDVTYVGCQKKVPSLLERSSPPTSPPLME